MDPGIEELVDVLPALGVTAARRVGVRQLVHERDLGPAGEERVDVELAQHRAPVGDLAQGYLLEALHQRRGVGPAVGLAHADDHVGAALLAASGLGEHVDGLPDTRRGAEVDAELSPGHGLILVPRRLSGRRGSDASPAGRRQRG